jgi:hypothetical protein
MTAQITKRAAGLLATVATAGALALGLGFAPTASAAQDCGYGYHLDGGSCVVNLPGPGARFDPGHPNCWTNDLGDQRCYAN